MSRVKVDAVQLGDNADATKNFTFRTNNNGTLTLARGNSGATSQDVLTIDANGRISMPQTVVAFSASQSTGQSLAAGVVTKLICNVKEYDSQGWYDAATGRFTSQVPGYFNFHGGLQAGTSATDLRVYFYKNGAFWKIGGPSVGGANWNHGSCDMYLNGTTDYAECFVMSAVANTTHPSSDTTYFQGHLIAKA